MALKLPAETWKFEVPENFWEPNNPAFRFCVLPIWNTTRLYWSQPGTLPPSG